jgi:hypothetical protein
VVRIYHFIKYFFSEGKFNKKWVFKEWNISVVETHWDMSLPRKAYKKVGQVSRLYILIAIELFHQHQLFALICFADQFRLNAVF